MNGQDLRRVKDAIASGRTWAEEKASHLEGTSPRDWPDVWDAAWSGGLHVASPSSDPSKLTREEIVALFDRATDAARERWEEIVEAARALEDGGAADGGAADSEVRAVALCEALRDHVPAGLSVGRDGSRVYLQDVSDAAETTVTSLASATRAISDWQERHLGR